MEQLRVFSFGGGVQSTAVLVLAARKQVQYDALLFANVGDDSENPETLEYVNEVAWPYAERHGIRLEQVQKIRRDKSLDTLLDMVYRNLRSLTIPVKFQTRDGKRGRSRRSCTTDFKIKPIAKWLRHHGATALNPATVGLGISTDEFQRARTDSGLDYEILEYPLLDRRLSRSDCRSIITSAGLAIPPKSACWFCPFKSPANWQRLRQTDPARFSAAVDLEQMLDRRGAGLGIGSPVRLTNSLKPLDLAVMGDQLDMFDEDPGCDSGHCFT